MTLSGFDGSAIEIGAVELPKVQMGRIVIDWTPADCRDVLETAVDQDSFGVGIVQAMIIGKRTSTAATGVRAGVRSVELKRWKNSVDWKQEFASMATAERWQ